MLEDTTLEGLCSLANINSIAAVAWILGNKARQTVSRHRILKTKPRTNGIQAFIYYPQVNLATLTTMQTLNLAHILPLTLSKNGFFLFYTMLETNI